jgi:fermentation-respiration switch protein FrsA (DUF1100 family)
VLSTRRSTGHGPVRLAFVAVVLCATIAVTVVLLEESMIYFPTRYPEGFWDTRRLAEGSGGSFEDHYFTTEDGLRLHGWWARPAEEGFGTARVVLLLFHGNAGNLSDRADLVARLLRLPVQVFIIDYRGYGRSEGRPTEEGLYLDAQAAWRYLVEERSQPPQSIVLFGRSLGGAVAVDLATRARPGGLILESTFTSMAEMAGHHFPVVPRFLIRTRMDSLVKIGSIAVPKLHIHSPADEVVPYRLGQRLYEAGPNPKRFHEVPGAGHNETYLVGGASYMEAIRSFLTDCQSGAG